MSPVFGALGLDPERDAHTSNRGGKCHDDCGLVQRSIFSPYWARCASCMSQDGCESSELVVHAQLWPGQEAGDTDTELPPEEQQRLGRKRKVRSTRLPAQNVQCKTPAAVQEAAGAFAPESCDRTHRLCRMVSEP